MEAMSAILYPIAETVEQALHAPLAHAEREREARDAAGGAVTFVSEAVGPGFVSEDAARTAYAALAPGEWRSFRPVSEAKPAPPRKPVNRDGRRWPAPKPTATAVLWRLSVSYWRIVRDGEAVAPPDGHARRLRRDPASEALDARALRALTHQPLRAARPQQALDIGLFEVRMPEDPARTMPDE
jgi:hypothetical protein